jgi:hypothetical protein
MPRDRAFRCRGNQRSVFAENSSRITRLGRLPLGHSALDLRIGNVNFEHSLGDIHVDDVAIADARERFIALMVRFGLPVTRVN